MFFDIIVVIGRKNGLRPCYTDMFLEFSVKNFEQPSLYCVSADLNLNSLFIVDWHNVEVDTDESSIE